MIVQTRVASRCLFSDIAPNGSLSREWLYRAANFVVSYMEFEAGETISANTTQEHMVYLRSGAATVFAGGERAHADEPGVFIIPPGPSRIEMREAGRILRVFSSAEAEIASHAANAQVYADGAPEVSPAILWLAPLDEAAQPVFHLRHYKLSDYADCKMRVFRSTNIMVNIFDFDGPRDPEALSPHSHEDFEQGSFGMDGEWIHSLRYPWSKKMSDWREDEHLEISSPSILVIPAGVIHTTRSVAAGRNQLVDVFCPPRRDFVEMGYVCNEADYATASEI